MTLRAVEQPDFLTIEETAALLRVGRTTCYTMAREDRLPGAFRWGSQYRVDRSALLSWIRSQSAGAVR